MRDTVSTTKVERSAKGKTVDVSLWPTHTGQGVGGTAGEREREIDSRGITKVRKA